MFTITTHRVDGDKGVTEHLTAKRFSVARSQAQERLPSVHTASVVLELNGEPIGKWHRVGNRAEWSHEVE